MLAAQGEQDGGGTGQMCPLLSLVAWSWSEGSMG